MNPPTTTIATNLTSLTFTTAALSVGTTYYWTVNAKNGSGATSSPVGSFTTFAPYSGGGGGGIPVTGTGPTLTWATPAAITYGTALGPNQLDAAANVQGFFTYKS